MKPSYQCLRKGLSDAGLLEDARLPDHRYQTGRPQDSLCALTEYVDVLIPRGGAGLIKTVVENSTIPVIETGTGNCHIYVDEGADLDMAVEIIFNAKTQRIGVCNACESLLVHKNSAPLLLPKLKERLDEKNVEIRADERARAIVPQFQEASEEDWGTEYLDYILSLKLVDSLDEAIDHINTYNTGHSEAIITRDYATCPEVLKRGGRGGCLCERLHPLYRRLRVRLWRGDRNQHPEASRQRPHGTQGTDNDEIYHLWKRSGEKVIC